MENNKYRMPPPAVTIGVACALGFQAGVFGFILSRVQRVEDKPEQARRYGLMSQVYARADRNQDAIVDLDELRLLARDLQVIQADEALPQSEIEARINSAPIPALEKYLQ